MPSIEAIDRIKNIVNSLGNEEAILQQKGASIEDVLPPEEGMDDELQDLLAPGLDMDELGTVDSLLSSLEEEPGESDFALEDMLTGGEEDFLAAGDDLFSGGEEALDDLEELDMGERESPVSGAEELTEGDLEDLEDLGDLGDLEDLDSGLDGMPGDLSFDGEMPDAGEALGNLAREMDEEPLDMSGDMAGEEIVLDEDFGLNEIEDDFLDDLNEEDENQFSLDDLGAEYNFTEDESDLSVELGLDLDELEKDIDRTVESESAQVFEISHGDMEKLETALYVLPLNLKIAIQDFLSDDATSVEQLNKMIALVMQEASPRQVAGLYKKFTGKQVDIPRGYEKKSGEDFARERASLRTFVRERVFPRILLGLGVFFSLWLLTVILFQFVYRPLKAESLYSQGVRAIGQDDYALGEEYFNSAFFGWDLGTFQVRGVPREDKFFLYADAYRDRRKFDLAEKKYLQILQAYPENGDARNAYAELLSRQLIRYRDAEYVLKGADPLMLSEAISGKLPYESIPLEEITEINDLKSLILLGDNYLAWAETDPDMYEKARYIYATILKDKRGGGTDEVLLRMFRYLIRTDNEKEIESLRLMYRDKEKVNASPTLQAEVFSELAGWLIDKGRALDAREFILKAESADRTVPDSHYQYARFFSETYNYEGEKDALTNALGFLGQMPELDKRHIFMQIDAYRRLGNLSLYTGEDGKAEQLYLMALEIYENSHRLNLIGTSPEIGALYTELGNLKYDTSTDYDRAMEYFELAKANQGDSPEINYKMGYIHYTGGTGDESAALMDFYRVSRAYPDNRNLLLAMGNTLTKRGDFYGAVSHYEQLLAQLRVQERNIKVLLPDEKEEEWALLEYLIMTYNNLGVAQSGIAEKTPNRAMERSALSSFTASSEYFDKLLRNRSTARRTELPDRAGENRQLLLDGGSGEKDLTLYDRILPHLDDLPRFYRGDLEE